MEPNLFVELLRLFGKLDKLIYVRYSITLEIIEPPKILISLKGFYGDMEYGCVRLFDVTKEDPLQSLSKELDTFNTYIKNENPEISFLA